VLSFVYPIVVDERDLIPDRIAVTSDNPQLTRVCGFGSFLVTSAKSAPWNGQKIPADAAQQDGVGIIDARKVDVDYVVVENVSDVDIWGIRICLLTGLLMQHDAEEGIALSRTVVRVTD
jgi:hypothetical protein